MGCSPDEAESDEGQGKPHRHVVAPQGFPDLGLDARVDLLRFLDGDPRAAGFRGLELERQAGVLHRAAGDADLEFLDPFRVEVLERHALAGDDEHLQLRGGVHYIARVESHLVPAEGGRVERQVELHVDLEGAGLRGVLPFADARTHTVHDQPAVGLVVIVELEDESLLVKPLHESGEDLFLLRGVDLAVAVGIDLLSKVQSRDVADRDPVIEHHAIAPDGHFAGGLGAGHSPIGQVMRGRGGSKPSQEGRSHGEGQERTAGHGTLQAAETGDSREWYQRSGALSRDRGSDQD